MEKMELLSKFAKTISEVEGGSYSSWSSSEFPILAEAKLGAGLLLLHPHAFALPHYADTSKFGYVLHGTEGRVGMVLPNSSQQIVLKLKKGDIIPVPLGSISWWYNKQDSNSDLVIVFLGETSKSYTPGDFNYFILTGIQGILPGFSTEFNSHAYKLSQKQANKLAKSQSAALITKLEVGKSMPEAQMDFVDKMVYNIDDASPTIEIKNGGTLKISTGIEFRFLESVGLSANHVLLNANAMYSLSFTVDSTTQLVYVVKGSGHVQIVGINGKRFLDAKAVEGQLFVVPRFFVAAIVAGDEGMVFLSMLTNARPVLKDLVGADSVWDALSPEVLEAALNINSEFEELFRSNIKNSTNFIPPTN